ncbi:MAG: hypothetical protein CMM61_10845 [Rhodospirillaceae bacterium]|nr:hypothetical protein [Rhodospirillaceae bacterium]
MGAMGGIVLAISYRIGAMYNGDLTPPWMGTRDENANEWLFALGSGGVLALILFVAYFVLHGIATSFFGIPAPAPHLPGAPGVGVALSVVLAVAIRLTNGNLPILGFLVPSRPFIRPLLAFGGRGALIGLFFGAVYTVIVASDPEQDFFIFHELNPWAFDDGFFIGLIGWMAWKAVDKDGLQQSVYLSVRTSAMVCWLFVGSWTFSSVFSYLGGHDLIEHWVLSMDLSPVAFLIMAQIIIFLLGWPLEWSEIIIIFVPIFLPMLPHFGIDPLFFGILVALNLQTSFLTPPMAMAAYYLKGVAPPHIQLMDIFRGVMPYLALILLAMVLMYNFPGIALWLPTLAYG